MNHTIAKMMKNTALITGASSGIGKELAKIHASKGKDVILVARREKELNELKEELERVYGVMVLVIAADLMDPAAPKKIFEKVIEEGIQVDYLMNNAGLGGYGYFRDRSLEKEMEMIRLNVLSLVELTHLFLPAMVERGKGKILNTSSSAGFLPGPLQTTYYATKAFVNSFSAGLDQEVRRHGITVTALCPGPVKTGFENAAGMAGSGLFDRAASASSTALKGYRAMEKGKLQVITDFSLKIMIRVFLPFFPLRAVLHSVERLQKVK
jgi:uncharacterized protein